MSANRIRRPVLAAMTAMALTLIGAAPAAAKTSTAPPSAAPDVRPACAAAKPGYASCLVLVRTNVRAHKGLFAPDTAPSGYGPSDLQSAYSLPSATAGSGKTVAVVDAYNDPDAEADLQTYRAQYGLPVCDTANGCFRKVNQEGQQSDYPSPDPSWAIEESLDIDMVSAICPNCHILLVEANGPVDTDLGAAVNEAVKLGAKYVSNSYGGPESTAQLTYDTEYYDHPGVAITASAGDSGYGVNYPSASQYVTAVGGTSLTKNPSVPRGWSEAAWIGSGSGCSVYEQKPAWQKDSGCANRTTADVSADADPDTGVALYDSYDDGGWLVVGGTSVASPIIASTYALAGTPARGTYPSSYPYLHSTGLNNITTGSNGTCTITYLCTAGPGYNGPTGLGTPDGITAFSALPSGTVTGTAISAKTGAPVPGAQIDVGHFSTTTNSSGEYTIGVPAGTYRMTVRDLDYAARTASQVQVTAGQTTTEVFTLRPVPTVTLSGTVTDGSGHGWPLYAEVTVPGTSAVDYTDPATGRYTLTLPENSVQNLQADPVYPGYQQDQQTVTTGTANLSHDFAAPVDITACSAPGYRLRGSTQRFNGTTTPPGWSVENAPGTSYGWEFDDPGGMRNVTGGKGNFAVASPQAHGNTDENTDLISPVMNLTNDLHPIVEFDTEYQPTTSGTSGSTPVTSGSVDVTTNGGQTWTTVWTRDDLATQIGKFVAALPQAAGKPDVQIRFHWTGVDWYWEVDNVFLGTCTPSPGGLVEGSVTDQNTDYGIAGADVIEAGPPTTIATTALEPGPAGADGGFYWMFSPLTGSQKFRASAYDYFTQTATTNVTAKIVTQQNFTLPAGHLSIAPGSISATQPMGATGSEKVTVTNTGSTVADFSLSEHPGGFAVLGQRSSGHMPTASSGWTGIPSYPSPIADNLMATDPANGDVYSVGGEKKNGDATAEGYFYRPGDSGWTPIPKMPYARTNAGGGFINGKLYLVGGFAKFLGFDTPVFIYNPATQKWSIGATVPNEGQVYGTAVVLNGKIYLIGGDSEFGSSTDVYVYDPAANTWEPAASYPESILLAACGAFNDEIYCAGGQGSGPGSTAVTVSAAYVYNPGSNTWSPTDPLPKPLEAASYAAANGQLLVSGGLDYGAPDSVTNKGYVYTPGQGWSSLPAAPAALYDSGGACGPGGFYRVGGFGPKKMTASAEVLSGYSDCSGGTGVPWLTMSPSTGKLNPGQRVTVTVTMNAGDPSITQPGAYTAGIVLDTNTPYPLSVPVTMNVARPKSWGEITGTVTSGGHPLANATVQIDTFGGTGQVTYTVTTNADGEYTWWLDHRYNPLQVIASDASYAPQAKTAKITVGETTVLNFSLKKT